MELIFPEGTVEVESCPHTPITQKYKAVRISGNWPPDRDLITACDNGKVGGEASHFGGRIERREADTCIVCVYID